MAFSIRSSRRRYREYRRTLKETRKEHKHDLGSMSMHGSDGPRGPQRPRKPRSRSFFALLKEFFVLLRGHQWTIALALVSLGISTLLGLIPLYGTKIVFDSVLRDPPLPPKLPHWIHLPHNPRSILTATAVGMVVLAVTSEMFGLWSRWQTTRITKRVQVSVRKTVFDHAVRLPLHRVYDLKSGGVASILREDAGGVADLIFSMLYNPSRAIVQLLGSLVILAFVDWRLLLGSLALLPTVWLTHRTWIGRIRPLFRDIRNTRQNVDSHATEAFGGMRVVRSFSRQTYEAGTFTRNNHLMARQEIFAWWWMRGIDLTWSILIPVASALLLYYGGGRVLSDMAKVKAGLLPQSKALTVGDLVMFLSYLAALLGPIATLASSATGLQNSLAGLDRVLDLLAEPSEMPARPGAIVLDRAHVRGRITVENVSFAYPGKERTERKGLRTEEEKSGGIGQRAEEVKAGANGASSSSSQSLVLSPQSSGQRTEVKGLRTEEEKAGAISASSSSSQSLVLSPQSLVLDSITLDVQPGEMIALVGPSGAGKTTLCNLIARFFDPTAGRILLDGVDLRDITVESYRRLLGIVEQDTFLFDGTIAQNIAYGRRGASDAEIEAAALAANAHGFIAALPSGYDTLIGERGVKLSGGQRQRLTIARALLADPRILILDEATSNLDTESERLIQSSLQTLMSGRTSFVIAHRLSTIAHANRILVIENGRIAEQGQHDELMAASGRYREMVDLQTRPPVSPVVVEKKAAVFSGNGVE